jgi:hypothetical protein
MRYRQCCQSGLFISHPSQPAATALPAPPADAAVRFSCHRRTCAVFAGPHRLRGLTQGVAAQRGGGRRGGGAVCSTTFVCYRQRQAARAWQAPSWQRDLYFAAACALPASRRLLSHIPHPSHIQQAAGSHAPFTAQPASHQQRRQHSQQECKFQGTTTASQLQPQCSRHKPQRDLQQTSCHHISQQATLASDMTRPCFM